MKKSLFFGLFIVCVVCLLNCTRREPIGNLAQLAGKVFALPTGTMADQLVLSRFPDAKFLYYNSVMDACLAVLKGKADAAAYDEPILKNIAAKNPGLKVLSEMITTDQYGFAVQRGNITLKEQIDSVLVTLRKTGAYEKMLARWLPAEGEPLPMPRIEFANNGVLRLGTAAVTEPFSYIDANQNVVGLDIEIASLVAQRLGVKLEIVNMDFGAMIPALISGKVDMIGACITISEERAKSVLFSMPYYTGGIAALVKE